jgi:hypothetical protein
MVAARLARPGKLGPCVGVLVGAALGAGWVLRLQPPLSFSAINYDEMLLPFFARIMAAAALIAVGSMAAAVLALRLRRTSPGGGLRAAAAGVVALLESAALLAATIAAWLHHGLLLPLALSGPDRMVEAYALVLSAGAVALCGLVAMATLELLERRSGPAAARGA